MIALAILAASVPAIAATPPAGYEVTLSSDDGDLLFRFPAKPNDATSEGVRMTEGEICAEHRFVLKDYDHAYSAMLTNCHRAQTPQQMARAYEGALQSLNGKHKDHPLTLQQLPDVTIGKWKGKEFVERDGVWTLHIRFFSRPHGFLAISARWKADDAAEADAARLFLAPVMTNNVAVMQSHAPPQFEFFYEDVRPPLAVAYRMVDRARQCTTLFAGRCKLPPELAGDGIPKMIHLFGVLTHAGFEQLPPLPRPETLAQAMVEVPGLKQQFSQTLLTSEKALFARIGAVLAECPSETSEAILGRLSAYQEVNFTRFWEQSEEVYALTSTSIARETREYQKQIHSGWNEERCIATYPVARKITGMFAKKTKPFAARDWTSIPRSDRFASASSFAWELAYTLEYAMDPSIDDRL